MSDEPREPSSRTEVHRVADPDATRVAGYLAQPRRGRPRAAALQRRPGHERDAQVDPGRVRGRGRRAHRQPRAAGGGLRRRARARRCSSARSTATSSTRARSSRASTCCPAIKANADYGDGYPLFTALGRPLIAKLAVEYARESGCDTIAHGCTGKGNDQVRIEGTVATLAPELKVIAPVRSWAMGRDEEIAYARKHGIPVKGGTESAPYSIDDNLWGRSSEGKLDRGPLARARRRRLPARHAAGAGARRAAGRDGGRSSAGVPVALDGERMELVDLIERAAEIGMRHGDRDRRPHRGPDRRPEGARHLRGAGGGDPAARRTASSSA